MDFLNLQLPEKTAQEIARAVQANRLAHAVVLAGADAEQRLAVAKCIAAALVCQAQDGLFGAAQKPCNACGPCDKVFADIHPDVQIIAGTGGPSGFHVEAVREMRTQAYVLPNEADAKVYILCDVHTMTAGAQNAILKVLEEPPTQVYFLLLCAHKDQLLPTIVSRTTAYDLGEKAAPAEDTQLAAAQELLAALTTRKEYTVLKALAPFEKDKAALQGTLQALQGLLHEALLAANSTGSPTQAAAQAAVQLSCAQLITLQQQVQSLLVSFDKNENYTLLQTRVCSVLSETAMRA